MTRLASAAGVHTVLVPGLGCSLRLWDSVLAGIWGYGSVAVADTRRDDSVAAMAQRLLATAPPEFALAGVSMGGYVALEVMRQAPERVSGLALISTSARADTEEARASRADQAEVVRRGGYGRLIEMAFPALVDPSATGRSDLAGFWRQMALEVGPEAFCAQLSACATRGDSWQLLNRLRSRGTAGDPVEGSDAIRPVAVIHGCGDQLIPLLRAQEMAAAIPGAVTSWIDAAGHLLTVEAPDALRTALGQWLTRVAAP